MIICFNEKINNFNENNLKSFSSHQEKNSYIQALMPDITDVDRNICPCCHAKNKLIKYRKNGFDALKPKTRTDTGLSRKILIECIDKIEKIKEKYPYITGKGIYTKLIEEGDILTKNVSLASLYRFLNNNHFHIHNITERKAFEMEFANDCWQRRYLTWSNFNY